KESFVPAKTDRVIYVIAPTIAVAAAFLAWSVIPIGLWYNVQYWIADVNVGVLLIFAVSSLNVYAIVLGGYASNNKYSLLGGLRSAAQLISYEMAMGLSVVPPVLAFFLKVVFFVFVYIWLRGTFPRLRYDMLMRLGWKVLLPLGIVNVMVTGVIIVLVQG